MDTGSSADSESPLSQRFKQLLPCLLLLPIGLLLVVGWAQPVANFHLELSLAGTAERFVAAKRGVSNYDAFIAVALDTGFVLVWLATVPFLLRVAVKRWAPSYRIGGAWSKLWIAAIAAGILDLAENVFIWTLYGSEKPPSAAVVALTVIAWWKFFAYAVAAMALLFLIIGPVITPLLQPWLRKIASRVFDRVTPQRDEQGLQVPTPRGRESGIGICVSGGGIRATSVALGALEELDSPQASTPTIFRQARWLSAVSGGAYLAGGWLIGRDPELPVNPQPTTQRDGLFAADGKWTESIQARRRYLDNGHLSLTGGVLGALVRTIFVLGAIVSGAALVGWAAGWVVGSYTMFPDFPFASSTASDPMSLADLLPARLVAPSLVLLALSPVALILGASRSVDRWRTTWRTLGFMLAGAALGFAVVLIALPIALRFSATTLDWVGYITPDKHTADSGTSLLGILSALGIIGALVKVLVSQVQRRALRLGGVLLAVLLILIAGKIASDVARSGTSVKGSVATSEAKVSGEQPFRGRWVLLVGLGWLLAYECVSSHRQTLAGIYRKRLAGTFALAAGDEAPLPSVGYRCEHTWPAYGNKGDGPELLICATAHARGARVGGLPALGVTFRPSGVTLYDEEPRHLPFLGENAYPKGSWRDGFPRGWVVSRSMAITGAAFASAMGRQAIGTTNALLVAFNLRLGTWIPNPRFPEAFQDHHRYPRVHIGYLIKELLGAYHPERDPFIYVADGGHRDNLGLVDLLRERPTVVLVIDASGDEPNSFTTLREAIDLTAVELQFQIDIDLTPVRRVDTALPADCVAAGTIQYTSGERGLLLYGRYQLCERSPLDLQHYANRNPRFPNYSTGDQFLDDDEYLMLVSLGRQVGERLRAHHELFQAEGPEWSTRAEQDRTPFGRLSRRIRWRVRDLLAPVLCSLDEPERGEENDLG
jgi:hypothetical protein